VIPAVITYFGSLFDTHGRCVRAPSWRHIFDRFARPRICARKEQVAGWSPALLEDDSRAAGKRVLSLGALVVEYDHGVSVDEADAIWSDFSGCIYTTHSHTREAPRCRVVLPLSRRISADEHGRLWPWAESKGGPIDPKARDAKRFWYLPSRKPDGVFETRELRGPVLDVDEILSRCPIAPAPAATAVGNHDDHHPGCVGRPDVVDRARAYLATVPGAVSGEGGHNATFRVACKLLHGFGLDTATAFAVLTEWNARCQPPWAARDLAHKIRSADTTASDKPRGYLLQRGRAA
jgi:hypothetical protein